MKKKQKDTEAFPFLFVKKRQKDTEAIVWNVLLVQIVMVSFCHVQAVFNVFFCRRDDICAFVLLETLIYIWVYEC